MSYKITDTIIVDNNKNIGSIGTALFAGPVIIGGGTSTGTVSQPLQVTGTNGAYIGGNLGIGSTNPTSKLWVNGDIYGAGIVTAYTLNASKDPGTGIATDFTNSLFGNGWRVSSPGSTTYYKLATLPPGGGGSTFDHLIINGVLGAWTNGNQTPFEITFSNRGSFNYKYVSYGSVRSDVRIIGISTNSSVEIWAQHQASQFTKLVYNIPNSIESIVVSNPTSTTTAPTGTTVFDSSTATPRFIINESDYVGIGTISPQGALQIGVGITFTSSGNATFAGIVTAYSFRGDGSSLTGVSGGVSISTNTTNANQLIPFVVSTGSTTGFGATTLLVYNPSSGNLGIGISTPSSQLHITGQFQSTNSDVSTTFGTGQIYLNGYGTYGNRIDFNQAGLAPPSTTTRSVGTKIVLYPNDPDADYAIGIDAGVLWNSVPSSSRDFKWYAGITTVATLFGSGELVLGTTQTLTGTANQRLQVTGGAYVSEKLGIGTATPQSALDVRGAITIGVGTVGINSVFSTTDIQSWYYTNKSKSVSGDDTAPQAIYVGASGTAMFMVGDSGNDVNQYTLSTPYDVSTAGASIAAFSVATQETNPLGIDFNPTGTKMFISGAVAAQPGLVAGGEYVHEYSLSTAWTVSSAGYTTSFNVTAQDTAPQGVTFGNSGSKMYVCGSNNDTVYQYSLSTPYSLASGVTYDNISLVVGTNPLILETAPIDISFNSTGTVLWIAGSANDRIYEFRLGTAWDISTAVFYDDVYIGFNEITVTGLHVIPEQNVAYIVGSGSDTIYQYSTNTPAIEIASSGISSVSSIVLNNETRVKDKLYVKGLAHFDSNILTQGNIQVDGSVTSSGTLTANSTITLSGSTTGTIVLGTNQTTATLTVGGATQTGTMSVGVSTVSQTTNIQAGVSGVGTTKTINLGTGGASGSFTQINIGPTAGVGTVVINSGTNLLVGTISSTGTASQPLQVTGGAYVSGSVGIGTTNPTEKLQVQGNLSINGTTSYGSTTATTATVSQIGIHSGISTSTYRSIEYTIQATQGTNFHATKILSIHNGTTAYNSEYGTIYNNTSVGTFDVDVSGGNIRLLVTPASSSSTTYTINFVATKI